MSKYAQLEQVLRERGGPATFSFSELENELGFELPASAREYQAWWSNDETHSQAASGWMAAGYEVADVELENETVQFRPRSTPDPDTDDSPSQGSRETTEAPQPGALPPSEDAPVDVTPTTELERLYGLLALLPRYDHTTPRDRLPENGIYLFFERGEEIALDGWTVDRVVRVGTHRADGNFPGRIRQHYGNKSNLGGNKNSSVFRKHLGGALLRRQDPDHPHLDEWITQGGDRDRTVEEQVSGVLRNRFTFVCFEAPRKEDRMELERGLIGLLAAQGDQGASESWLGHHADHEKVHSSSLWNTQHTGAAGLSEAEFDRVKELIRGSIPQPVPKDTERLVVIPCGRAKIWDKQPDAGPTPAEEAYTGAPATVNQRYAREFGDAWLVLSAKYGLVSPSFRVPAPYDVTFNEPSSGPIGAEVIRQQARALGIDRATALVALGGIAYRDVLTNALEELGITIEAPFAGMRIGEMMSAINEAIERGDPGLEV